jgi:hypothetical protein
MSQGAGLTHAAADRSGKMDDGRVRNRKSESVNLENIKSKNGL